MAKPAGKVLDFVSRAANANVNPTVKLNKIVYI